MTNTYSSDQILNQKYRILNTPTVKELFKRHLKHQILKRSAMSKTIEIKMILNMDYRFKILPSVVTDGSSQTALYSSMKNEVKKIQKPMRFSMVKTFYNMYALKNAR